MTRIGIAGSGSGGCYRPVNVDRVLPTLIPVVGPVTSNIVALDISMFEVVEEYVEAVQAQAAYFNELLRDVEDIADVFVDQFGVDGDWYFTFESTLPTDIAEFAEIWEEDALTSNQKLFDVFADSVAFEMGRNAKRYNQIPVGDVVEHEKDNYRIVPDKDGNGATFQRKDAVEGAPVRVSTEVDDPWGPIEDDEHH